MHLPVRKIGRITVAIGLVAVGAALLMDNLLGTGSSYIGVVLRFWPVLLIGFGLEYLLHSAFARTDESNGNPVRLRFDFGGAFLLTLIIGATAGFNSLSQWISLNPRDYVAVGAASQRTETSAIPADGAKEVLIDIDLGRVELYPQKLSEVRVEAAYGLSGGLVRREQSHSVDDFQVSLDGTETIRVVGTAPKGKNLSIVNATYRIYLPENLKVRVNTGAGSVMVGDYEGDLYVNTKLGVIDLVAVTGNVEAETASGTIVMHDITGKVTARTSAGRVNLQRIMGAVEVDSGTGVISVEDQSGGTLVAETKTGSINVQSSFPLDGDMLLRTSAGSIELNLPAESSMKVSAQTKTGSIAAPDFMKITQNGPSRSASGVANGGQHTITLEAQMGTITLHTR